MRVNCSFIHIVEGVLIMKSFIQGLAMVALLLTGSAAVEAQINYRADVNIPFEFNVAGKDHEAGKYTIKINKQMAVGAAALVIQQVGSDEVQTILLGSGGGERSDDVRLIFSSIYGRKYLTGVNTVSDGFQLVSKKILESRLAKSAVEDKGKKTDL